MKEFSFPNDVFQSGLRKYSKRQLNQTGLMECVGFKLGAEGLESWDGISTPIVDPASEIDWPFPQLVQTSKGIFLLTRTAIYSVNYDWSLTLEISGLSSGGVWDYLDFGSYMVFSNGVSNVTYTPSTDVYAVASTAIIPANKAMCNFRGQVVLGNTAKGENFIEWSDIGYLNFTLNRRNEAGNRHMEWTGPIFRLGVLDNKVIVYGENGISLLQAVATPVVAFGYETIARYGIVGRGAVGISDTWHVFIDGEFQLRKLTSKGIETLGYSEFLSRMLIDNIVFSYNPHEDEFYLSDGVRCFVISQMGMTEIQEAITSGMIIDGSFAGIAKNLGYEYRTIVTNPFDLNYRAQKTLQSVLVGVVNSYDLDVASDWRNNQQFAFTRSPFFPINAEGVSNIVVSGVEHCVVLRWPIEVSPELPGQMTVTYKLTDKRSIRGTHVPIESNT